MDISMISSILILSLCIGVSHQQTPRCLLSREDYLICKYQNNRLQRATTNEYSVHHTRLRQGSSGFLECNVRAAQQDIRGITNLGTDEMRIMFSPGFVLNEQYDNQIRTEYLVQCTSDELAFFNVTTLNMQGSEDCQDEDGNFRCQDYFQIMRGVYGTTDICGTIPRLDAVVQLEFGDYTAVFRSSEEIRGVGFQMYSVCFRQSETNLMGCFEISEFTTGVCSLAPPTVTPPTTQPPQSKRAATKNAENDDMAMAYADIFTGYPDHLLMNRDLASFHHQWNRVRRQAEVDVFTVNIAFNQTVFYLGNTISVFDPDSDIIPLNQYFGVLVLQTFNATGDVNYFFKDFSGDRTPHFTGPGPLIIVGRHAYFQLFAIDPRELLPNEEEQIELVTMTQPLLAAVPPEDDVIQIDPTQEPADLSQFGGLFTKRQAVTPSINNLSDREAILSALRNMEACNPVLRAQSRATLTFYNGINASFVDSLRVFPISCTLTGNMLSCITDTTTLPGRTLCQIDTQTPILCEPFGGTPFVLQSTPTLSVTVTAVNCLGQRAERVVSLP